MKSMAMLVFVAASTLSGCVTIPMEYRYYSHQNKSMVSLELDRQMCYTELQSRGAAGSLDPAKRGEVNWEAVDSCLQDFGWRRR